MSLEEKPTERTEKKTSDTKDASNAISSEVRTQFEESVLSAQGAAGQKLKDSYDTDVSDSGDQSREKSGTSNGAQVAAVRNALNTEPWKPVDSGNTPTAPKDVALKPVSPPAVDQPQPIQPVGGVTSSVIGSAAVLKLGGSGGDNNLQPPPNVISAPANGPRTFEQPHGATTSSPPLKSEVSPPPLEKGNVQNTGPISGPPPIVVQKPLDTVPAVVGEQPGGNRLVGQVSYGSTQEKQLDNRQAISIDGSGGVREAPGDKRAQSDVPRTESVQPMVRDNSGATRLPDTPTGVPHGRGSESGNALLIIGKKDNQQLRQDIEKFGEQEAAKRFHEARQQSLKTESTSAKVDAAKSDSGDVKTAKVDQSARGDQSNETKTKSEPASVDGRGSKTESASSDSKGATKAEAADGKGGKPEVQTPESKTSKSETGTRPGDLSPTGGKIAEINPEGTRSGDIDKSGKVAEISGGSKGSDAGSGSKHGDVTTNKTTDGKSTDGPTSKGPEVGLVGKTGEAGGKSVEPSGKGFEQADKTQDGRNANAPDKRSGIDGTKSSSGQASGNGQGAAGDRGGGLGSGWKDGSTKSGQGTQKDGETSAKTPSSKEGQSEKNVDNAKRGGKEPADQSVDSSTRRDVQLGGRADSPIKGNVQTDVGSSKSGGAQDGATKGGGEQKGWNSDQKSGTDKPGSFEPKRAPDKKLAVKDDVSKTDVSPNTKGLRSSPPTEGKVAEASASSRKEPPKQTEAKDDQSPPRKTEGGVGLIPGIKFGGIPGVSIPEWLVKGEAKKTGQNAVGKDKGKDSGEAAGAGAAVTGKGKGIGKDGPESSNSTEKTKAVREDNQAVTAKQNPIVGSKDKGEKPRVDLLLPGKSRKEPGALVSNTEKASKTPTEQSERSDNNKDSTTNQRGRKVPMQLAGRETEPLPAIGKIPKPQENVSERIPGRAVGKQPEKLAEKQVEKDKTVEKPPNTPEKILPATNSLGNRDAVMALLLGKGKESDSRKVDLEKERKTDSEENSEASYKVSSVPKVTISGVLGGPKRLTRRWQATESGTFKLNSSDSLKALKSGDILPNERLTQTDKPNWIRDQYVARQAQQSKQRRTYIAQEGDHLGLVAVKTVGRTSPAIERLFLQLNPHLEMRRTFSEAHNTDVSFLEAGSILSLPTLDEIQNVP